MKNNTFENQNDGDSSPLINYIKVIWINKIDQVRFTTPKGVTPEDQIFFHCLTDASKGELMITMLDQAYFMSILLIWCTNSQTGIYKILHTIESFSEPRQLENFPSWACQSSTLEVLKRRAYISSNNMK